MSNSKLLLEHLEDRTVPVTWGNPWPDATHLTASFVTDGTQAESQTTNLFANLDDLASTQSWQLEVLRALQTWAVQGNVNVGLVADGGEALGSAGRPQGDSRFGDIRISGFEMAQDVIAITNPFNLTGGTTSGDIRFNTNTSFSIGGENGVDLFTAALHEAGHSFGLPGFEDPTSATYAHYQGVIAGLSESDIAQFQTLYGSRDADQHEGFRGNDQRSTATALNLISNGKGASLQVTGDVTDLSDADFYSFRAPLSVGSVRINLRAEGLSLLTSKVTIYDSRGRELRTASVDNPLSNDITISLSNVKSFSTYYVKVEGSTNDVFSIGSYELEIESLPVVNKLFGFVGRTVTTATDPLLSNDLHLNDSFLTASLLPLHLNGTTSSFDYGFRGSIHNNWDVDYYKIQAPQNVASTDVMTVMAWGLDDSGLSPEVSVYDAQQNLVDADVLVNADGFYSIQVRDIEASASYFVKLEGNTVGNYFLGVDFSSKAVELDHLAEGVLDADSPTASTPLNLDQTQQIHFVLNVETMDGQDANVEMTVSDAEGNVVTTLRTESGRNAVTQTIRLEKGKYTIKFAATAKDGGDPPEVQYSLSATKQSDPIGPQPEDSTEDPESNSSTPPQSPPMYDSSTPPPSEPSPEEQQEDTTPRAEDEPDSAPPPQSPPMYDSSTPPPSESSPEEQQEDTTPRAEDEQESVQSEDEYYYYYGEDYYDESYYEDEDYESYSGDQSYSEEEHYSEDEYYYSDYYYDDYSDDDSYYGEEDQRGLEPEEPYDDPYAPH